MADKTQRHNLETPDHIDSSKFHFLVPDYDRTLYEIPPDLKKRILDSLYITYDKPRLARGS